ncbi:hypothetical protein KKG90_01865 [Candidatus Bipolaricaulota bacterium]|nr:hypothetical protein [Candidatus Bipolaricaulota bacterium]
MRIRGGGGILVALWLVTSLSCFSQGVLLYLHEEPLSFSHPILQQGSTVLIPLGEFCRFIGLEFSYADNEVVLRGSGFRQAFDVATFSIQNEIIYADLNWMMARIGGEIHQIGGGIYLKCSRPHVSAIDASSSEVTVRLSGFSSHELSTSQQGLSEVVRIFWPNTELELAAQLIRVGESDIQAVRMLGTATGVELSMTLEAGTILSTVQLETDEFYTLTFRVSSMATTESIIETEAGIVVHEWENSALQHELRYLFIESWRDRFRLRPTVPAAGYPTTASLQTVLHDASAVVAISLDCSSEPATTECLVMKGIPYQISETPSEVLAIDLFGRWAAFSSLCSVRVKHAGQWIEVDGVSRPLIYGEVVMYAPGYAQNIARGILGSFTAIKIRDNRVVSVYQGSFVPEDPSAILLVASGEARVRLADIHLGDPIEVDCQFAHADGTYPYAVSSGPQIMRDGALLSDDNLPAGTSFPPGGTVLASDWQGGLYVLAYEGGSVSSSEADSILMDILHSLPTVLKDVVLLSSCGESGIAYAAGDGSFQLGSHEPIRLALSLIPLAP